MMEMKQVGNREGVSGMERLTAQQRRIIAVVARIGEGRNEN